MQSAVSFRPIGARYLVLPDEVRAEETTVGEFTISREKDHHKQSSTGVIVATGSTCEEPLYVGNRVAFGQYSGYEQKLDGKSYKVLAEAELLGEICTTPFDEPELPLVLGEIVQ